MCGRSIYVRVGYGRRGQGHQSRRIVIAGAVSAFLGAQSSREVESVLDSMDKTERAEFLYKVTQVLKDRIDELQTQVDFHHEVIKFAAQYFGFENPVKRSDAGQL